MVSKSVLLQIKNYQSTEKCKLLNKKINKKRRILNKNGE